MVVTVEQDIVTSEPLAGTRALSGSASEDAYNRTELQSDSKEIVEHVRFLRGLTPYWTIRTASWGKPASVASRG
ncbi:salicylate synthase [Salmonella enterica subsp. enterica serovar Newport str. SH111077]|nr:salicylate synthase [Salmonella enterica subsp. enterica serovar Newport str. SH111077]OSJ57952.1 salicylate synthase [Salmonella enterica subsp. enterica serovar Newport str. SHSN005]OSJ65977.1 salicylate synthase [Salmonella enterica subsp. enterica serovar Newport str. SHSN006]OSJ86529.1 salicylate synthase [Salmonella enterica subsp. enterica serovar Newport str. SHSN011]